MIHPSGLLVASLLFPLIWGWMVHALWQRLRPQPTNSERIAEAYRHVPHDRPVDYQI